MELSERCIAQFDKEGYQTIYEEKVLPNTPLPLPPGTEWSLFVTEGCLLVDDRAGRQELRAGTRYRSVSSPHQLTAGAPGCQVVIGVSTTSTER